MRTRWTNWLFLILLWPAALAQLVESGLDLDYPEKRIAPDDQPDLMDISLALETGEGPAQVRALAILEAQLHPEQISMLAWNQSVRRLLRGGAVWLEMLPDSRVTVNRRVELLLDPEGKPYADTLMKQLSRITGKAFATPEEWTRWWDANWRDFPAPARLGTVKERLAAFQARMERAKAPWPEGHTLDRLEQMAHAAHQSERKALSYLTIRLLPPSPDERKAQLEAALREYHDGNSAETERLLTTYLTSYPRDLHALLFRAHARTDQRKARESLEDLDAVRMLLGDTELEYELRRLNERLLAHPDFSLLQAWHTQNKDDVNPAPYWIWPDLWSDYTLGMDKFGLLGPGDAELLALAASHRDQPLVELGLLTMLHETAAPLEDFTRRHPDVVEGWMAMLFLFPQEPRHFELALPELRRRHPEDPYFRLLEATFAERNKFWSMQPAPEELRLSASSRKLLDMDGTKLAFPAGPAMRLLEVQMRAAETNKLRGCLWNLPITRLVNPGMPFGRILKPNMMAGMPGQEPAKTNRQKADLILVAEAHYQAWRLLAAPPDASVLQLTTAICLNLPGMIAEAELTSLQHEAPKEDRDKYLMEMAMKIADLMGSDTPPPLPSLARELIKELRSPPPKPK